MDRDLVALDPSVVSSAVVLDRPNSPIPVDGERDGGPETVELVLRLSREEALRLMEKLGKGEDQPGGDNVSAQDAENQRPTRSSTRLRTSSRSKQGDADKAQSQTSPSRTTRSTAAHPPTNGTPGTPTPAEPQQPPDQPVTPSVGAPEGQAPPTPLEMQGFLDTERSYTNAFHKTLSLFVDDKTFSTPSLRAAVVGFLESSNATVLETIPNYEAERIPNHLRQEIENHVNLVKTVLQRGGVFAEDFLRNRLNKLASHIPRIEAAIGGNRTKLGSSKAPMLYPRSNDPYPRGVSPETAAANAAALAQAAEAAARVNSRHHDMLNAVNGPPLTPDPNMHMPGPVGGFHGGPPPPMGPTPPIPVPGPQQGPMPGPGMPQQLPPMRGKTFVPPSMVPSQVNGGPPRPEESGGGGSPPPILAPFDPRPNPMACLFCRQRKIRCIGHKPHPCEICVKRGFVCSYDWISRRGKRKPKNPDGTPIDPPAGSVSVAVSGDGPQTVGGVPVVVPPTGPPGPHPPPPAVGMHPAPGMHPGMHMGVMPPGQPGPDGSVPPFAFTFIPGHPGQPFPAHMAHPTAQLPPQTPGSLPPSGPSSAAGGSPSARQGSTGDEMAIDPSLMDNQAPNTNGAAAGGGDPSIQCTFCKEQDLDCGGSPSEPCLNCSRRQLPCKYEPESKAPGGKKRGGAQNGRGKKKRGAAEETAAAGKRQKVVHPPQEDVSMNGDATPANGASADGDAEMDDQAEANSAKDDDEASKTGSAAAVEATL